MSYYKRLNEKELEGLKEDFVKFLVVNGIDADEWSLIQKESPEKANLVLDQFSEVIHEASLREARFLLMVDDHFVRAFQCGDERITLVGLDYVDTKEFSFHKVEDLQAVLSRAEEAFEIYSVPKDYAKKREHEMYDMIKAGCKISDGEVYKLLAMYWADLRASQN